MGVENYKTFDLFFNRAMSRLDYWRSTLRQRILGQDGNILSPTISSISQIATVVISKWRNWKDLITKYYTILSKNSNIKTIETYQRNSFFLAEMSGGAKGLGPP